jgi:hypothetical protein
LLFISVLVQLAGMVALLLASKMFGTGIQIKVVSLSWTTFFPVMVIHVSICTQAGLVELAPQLKLSPQELCDKEMKLIRILNFNLFIPTTYEFANVLISRLQTSCAAEVQIPTEMLKLDALHSFVAKYLEFIEKDMTLIQQKQSHKAVAVVQCALARWSIM